MPWVLLGGFIALGIAAELRSFARPDIGFLLYAARRVVDGARLYVDVVEINPPLIIALNIPPVLAASALGVSDILVYRLAFAAVLLGSLVLTWRALGRALGSDQLALRYLIIVLSGFVLFPLSAQDFGQREHLLLASGLLFVLNAVGRSVGRDPARGEAVAIGLLAALGFALKPHFLLLWPAAEVYLRLAGRTRQRLLPESITIAVTLVGYVATVAVLAPQYFHLVVALGPVYGRFLHDPFLQLLVTGPGAALVWIALLAYVALHANARNAELWTLLAIAVLLCFVGAASQQKGLRYHFYPSFGLSILLLGVIAWDVRLPLRSGAQRLYRLVAITLSATAVLVVAVENLAQALHRESGREEQDLRRLVQVVRARAAGSSIFVMSYHIGSSYPMVNYSGVQSASRFPHLWILAAEYMDELQADSPLRFHAPEQMSAAERFLNEAVLEDFRRNRPRLLIVLRSARDLPVNGYRRIDYIAYFGRDPGLRAIMDRYQRIGEVGEYALYELVNPGEIRSSTTPVPEPGTRDVLRADRQGLRLRIGDPAFLLRVLVFVSVGALVLLSESLRRRVARQV